jgi:hypothetical protein
MFPAKMTAGWCQVSCRDLRGPEENLSPAQLSQWKLVGQSLRNELTTSSMSSDYFPFVGLSINVERRVIP